MQRPVQQDLVSCIIIFFNAEPFLDEAIRSVLAQTYTNWELLLVDDGSSDGSASIARQWAAQHPHRIRVLQHSNGANLGMSASRNVGLVNVRGEFVAFLDADDVWLTHKLEEQVQLMRAHPDVQMVTGATELWFSWNVESSPATDNDCVVAIGDVRGRTNHQLQDRKIHPPELAIALYPLGYGFSPSSSNFMVRASLLDNIGGYVDAFRGPYEDHVFQVKAYLAGCVFISSRVWDRYRQHAQSAVSIARRDSTIMQSRKAFLGWFEQYVQDAGISDPRVHQALENAWWPFRHPVLFAIRQRVVGVFER